MFLQSSNVAESLFPNALFQTHSQTGLTKYKKGERVFEAGAPSDQVYFVVAGKAKISTVNKENKEITKAILGPGEIFGEMALTGETQRRDSAVALEPLVVRALAAADMLMLLRGRTDLTIYLMQLIASRQVEMESRLESLVFRDSRSRIVECLAKMADQKGQCIGYEWVIRKPVTHQEIANMTATSRQTVTTVLNDLRAMKLLKFNRKQVLIRDLEKLKAQIA